MEETITYFEKAGKENTEAALLLARKRADELGVRCVVVASYSGATGVRAVQLFRGHRVIVAAGVVGFSKPNEHGMVDGNRELIREGGGEVFFATHAFGTLGRAVHRKLGAIQVDEIIAHVLRRFGQGVKVACEISCMAADAGLLRTDEDAVAIAGTGEGADTALVLRPSNTHTFFEMKVLEIICKPRG